ncbi:MAG: A/G-specific adenine glycosylase [Desulfomonilia bacterium]
MEHISAGLIPGTILSFKDTIYAYYRQHARRFPWRETKDPYRILVTEIMLQQTQTERVAGKYEEFIVRFPDFAALARSDLHPVLEVWQGLGYNRRAVALKETAVRMVREHNSRLPEDLDELIKLPGIGRSTAGAILAFAYGISVAFIETNIRRVFLHFFFPERDSVKDGEILPLVEQTLDRENPRQWYYAIMDYGVMLKARVPNPNRKSAHYSRQAPFEGSNRQIRGQILKYLIAEGRLTETELVDRLRRDPARVRAMLYEMECEGFIRAASGVVSIR